MTETSVGATTHYPDGATTQYPVGRGGNLQCIRSSPALRLPITTSAMELTLETNDNPADASPPQEADEIRGMMPTFNVWQEAQQTLAAGRAASSRSRGAHGEPGTRRRWPLIAVAVAMLAIALTVQRAEGPDAIPLTATTPVNKMPWRVVKDPGGAFQVSLPAKPASRTVVSIAGSGRQLDVRIPQTIIAIQTFDLNSPNQARAMVDPMIRDRADELGGSADAVQSLGSPPDQSFETVVRSTTAIAILRVVLHGPTLYFFEFRGDADSQRDRQIYNYVVASFKP